jgi:PAS domain-containing protein
MPGTQQKSLVLILAREFSANLATPVFVVDPSGTLVFYNEPAEKILGQSYAEAGPLRMEQWAGTLYGPEDLDGRPLPSEGMPLAMALNERRPAHRRFRVTGLDGVKRTIEVTAFPLFARADEFVGAVAIFWEDGPQPSG